MRSGFLVFVSVANLLVVLSPVKAEWKVLPPTDQRTALPATVPGEAESIQPGDKWPQDSRFRWLIGDLMIPELIDDRPARHQPVGLQFNCGDGGAVYLDGELYARYDNDHPALVLVSERAEPGRKVHIAVQVYGVIQGGDTFAEARWVIVEPARAREAVRLEVEIARRRGPVPNGIVGLSQGGGLADYEDATAAKLREGGFKWFRMDNILTHVLKEKDGELVYEWDDFDRRADFIVKKMKAEPIFAASYMPFPLDAVDNKDRQSAPNDYGRWEELCYRAARRCIDRGVRVPYWEVWNEANTGWIKPGPGDTGSEPFRKLYREALGEEPADENTVRTFEAYCKLYAATARGVLRADPEAKIGGPALASGPFETENCHHCRNGKGFARGLMLFCEQEHLPLDFVSWHEYFHPADVFVREVKAFREYLTPFPILERSVQSFMITEWNEAWWPDRPQDHEVGAAWCADGITRAFIPHRIDRPCFFYVKQGDMNFRGDWSLLMAGNTPKATYNVLKIFNNLGGEWVDVRGGDDDISAVAAWDAKKRRLAVVLVNFRFQYAMPRKVELAISRLPESLREGRWREWTVDATHSNVWDDRDRAELTRTREEKLGGAGFRYERLMPPNSVILVELLARE
jgi:hypothetical protein